MTFFGILWIIICFYFLFAKDIRQMFILLIWSCVFQASAVFILNNQDISPFVITSIFYYLKFFITKFPKDGDKCNKNIFLMFSIFFIYVLFITLLGSQIFRGVTILEGGNIWHYKIYDGKIGFYRFVVLGVLCLDVILASQININTAYLKKQLIILSCVVLFFGYLSYILNLFSISPKWYVNLFYSNSSSLNMFTKNAIGSNARFASLFSEPSYCSTFISSIFWMIKLDFKNKFKYENIFLILLFIGILLTFSATAYVVFFSGFILYLLKNKNTKIEIILIISIVLILIIPEFRNIIVDSITNKLNSASGLTRSEWNKAAISVFFETKGIGIGFRVVRASSMMFNILAQIGLLGMGLVLAIICLFYNKNKTNFSFCSNFLLLVLIGQIVACPDLDALVLWMAFLLNSVVYNKKQNFI